MGRGKRALRRPLQAAAGRAVEQRGQRDRGVQRNPFRPRPNTGSGGQNRGLQWQGGRMNKPTVIRFERRQLEEELFQCKLVSPPRPRTPSIPSAFDVGILDGPFAADPVREIGSRIFQELCKNAAIKEAIGDALNAKFNSVQPIYIDTESVRAETICWEALWESTTRFLALDQRW